MAINRMWRSERENRKRVNNLPSSNVLYHSEVTKCCAFYSLMSKYPLYLLPLAVSQQNQITYTQGKLLPQMYFCCAIEYLIVTINSKDIPPLHGWILRLSDLLAEKRHR